MEEYLIMAQLLVLGGLGYIFILIRQLAVKPPIMINCECFRDQSHDDMKRIKEMYKEMLGEQVEGNKETEEEDGVQVKKEE